MNQPSPSDGKSITVDSITTLNTWYERFRCGSTIAVGGRYETRNGQLVGLGGLSWALHIKAWPGGPLTVSVDTADGEVLPDLPVVRAMFPGAVNRDARSAVAA